MKRKNTVPKKIRHIRTMVAVVVAVVIAVATAAKKVLPTDEDAVHGIPGLQVESLTRVQLPDEMPEIWLEYAGFDVSFNPQRHNPNYASWILTPSRADGEEERSNRFRSDNDVLGCARLDDYRNSGYDRGHMAPAGDMKWSARAMDDSHLLTNIVPQNRRLNSGRWNQLEMLCRQWVMRDSILVIVSGPIYDSDSPQTIGESRVAVPDRLFKAIIAPMAQPVRAIAFVMPNEATRKPLQEMAISIDSLEEITGYDFFSSLPDSIQRGIEASAHYNRWNMRAIRP